MKSDCIRRVTCKRLPQQRLSAAGFMDSSGHSLLWYLVSFYQCWLLLLACYKRMAIGSKFLCF